MKKLLTTLLLSTLLITSSIVPVFADNDEEMAIKAEQRAKEDKETLDLNIFIDGKELKFTKEENLGMPFIDKANRTLVPLRKPIEMSGNQVTWDQKTKTATIKVTKTTGNPKTVSIKIGDNFLTETVNGTSKKIKMDTKAIVKDKRTYIPLRAVLESIGLKVAYNKKTKTISAVGDGKVWQGLDEINKDFPNLIDGVKEWDPLPDSITLDTLKLDNSLQDKMKLAIEPDGTRRIKFKTPTRDGMLFIKDKKVVFRADSFLDDIYYYRYYDGDPGNDNPYATYQGDIEDVDYFMIYESDNPVATLIENPFKK